MDYSLHEKKLNKEQIKAVKHQEGPLLIIAGAGTGKTTVITERIKWLISQEIAKPSEILALTFTEKAAQEMEERVDAAFPYGYSQMWITTFHAFGERVLRQEALEIGLDPGYRLMTEAESVLFFRKNLFQFKLDYYRPLGNPTKFIEGLLQHFARLKDEDILPDEYLVYADKLMQEYKKSKKDTPLDQEEIDKTQELAQSYKIYEELKRKAGLMDFGDLITNTLSLFRTRKNILKEYKEQFKYLLIDEFQDTNFAQNELALLLAGSEQNITVVGDDDQAIYRWRGAAISNIIQFRQRCPKARLVVLNRNYRSTKEILNGAYQLIQNNNPDRLEIKENVNKKLLAERQIRGEKIELIYKQRVEDEAEEVIGKLKDLKLKNEERYTWKDFALLVRANNHADPFVRTMQRMGIPYQFLGPGKLFRQNEVIDLISYLKVLYDFSDSIALFRVLSMPIFAFSVKDLFSINNFARKVNLSLFDAIETVIASEKKQEDHWSKQKNYQSYLPFLSLETKNKLVKIYTMVEKHLKLAKTETAGQILYFFLEETGLLQKLTEYKNVKEERMVLNISQFFDKLKAYEAEHEDASIMAVVDWIDMMLELGESPLVSDTDWVQNDAVNILTVHSSKGLEFKVVFLVNLVDHRFPSIERSEQIPIPKALIKEILPEGDYHLEEERRLFYVGMTRARDLLFFSAANYYGEGKRERKISPFVIEVIGDNNFTKKQEDDKKLKQLSLLEWKKQENLDGKIIRRPIAYLSYSQIDAFSTCPLQYKYRYIAKIPVPTNAAGAFGTSIHAALQQFYEKVQLHETPSKEKLLQLLDKVWVSVGYNTKNYEEKMKERGKKMLTAFYNNYFNKNVVPFALEQTFKIKLTPILKIGGKIDRIDKMSDGRLEIIDYKTGKRPTDKQIKEDLQMTVYALAVTDPGILNKKPEEVLFTYYFLDKNEKVSSTRTAAQLIEAKKKLLEKSEEIATSTYNPKTGPWCKFCDFRLICEAW